MQTRIGVVALLLLTSCATGARPVGPAFYLCESILWSVRGVENSDGEVQRIDVVLGAQGRRDFHLFTKQNFGRAIEFRAGGTLLLRERVGRVIRGGNLQLEPPPGRGREILDRLLEPPKAPCGSASWQDREPDSEPVS